MQAVDEACVFRDDARTVLVAMVAELGPEYLPFAITVLRSALPARGYMGHVLGFTLHAVLAALVQVCSAPAPLAGQHKGLEKQSSHQASMFVMRLGSSCCLVRAATVVPSEGALMDP